MGVSRSGRTKALIVSTDGSEGEQSDNNANSIMCCPKIKSRVKKNKSTKCKLQSTKEISKKPAMELSAEEEIDTLRATERADCKDHDGDGISSVGILLIFVCSSMYPAKGDENGDAGNQQLSSWEDIRRRMNLRNDQLKQVLTSDCCVLLKGKCRFINIFYEHKILMEMSEISENLKFDVDKVPREAVSVASSEKYPREIVEYVFNKYSVPTDKVCDKSGEVLYRWNEEKMLRLRIFSLLHTRSEWNYQELIAECQRFPYCGTVHVTDKIVATSAIISRPSDDMSSWRVKRIAGFSELDARKIIKNNYARVFN